MVKDGGIQENQKKDIMGYKSLRNNRKELYLMSGFTQAGVCGCASPTLSSARVRRILYSDGTSGSEKRITIPER
jgi:hypothetical protein